DGPRRRPPARAQGGLLMRTEGPRGQHGSASRTSRPVRGAACTVVPGGWRPTQTATGTYLAARSAGPRAGAAGDHPREASVEDAMPADERRRPEEDVEGELPAAVAVTAGGPTRPALQPSRNGGPLGPVVDAPSAESE